MVEHCPHGRLDSNSAPKCRKPRHSLSRIVSHCSLHRAQRNMATMPGLDSPTNPIVPALAPLKSHLPSLDGMRAVSILLVIGCHAQMAFAPEAAYSTYLGRLGV